MKDRIKKFVADHQKDIPVFVAGSIVGALTVTVYAVKALDGKTVSSGDIWSRDDGITMMSLYHKNGSSTTLKYTPPSE